MPAILFATFASPAECAAGQFLSASIRYRAAMPAAGLRAAGIAADLISIHDCLARGFATDAATVVVAQPKEHALGGGFAEKLLAFVARQKDQGKRVAIDVSDLKLGADHAAWVEQRAGKAMAQYVAGFYRSLLGQADLLLTPTAYLAERLRHHLGPGIACAVVGDAVEVAAQAPRFVPPERLALLWFGTFQVHWPALARFCHDVLPALSVRHPLTLTFVCEAPSEEAMAALNALVSPRLGFRHVSWSLLALNDALGGCDLVALPFDRGSELALGKSNNRALQALQAGRAVAAHPIPSYEELRDFIALDDDLGTAIESLLADPAGTLARTARGQDYVATRYSPAAIARRWREALGLN